MVVFRLSPCLECSLCSFGNFPRTMEPTLSSETSAFISPRTMEPTLSSETSDFIIAQDDGTDIEFRNVGVYTSDAGEIPKRT